MSGLPALEQEDYLGLTLAYETKLDLKTVRQVLQAIRDKGASAANYFIPRLGLTVGEFAVLRLIGKWKITQAQSDEKGDG
jgi:hypothetical protein